MTVQLIHERQVLRREYQVRRGEVELFLSERVVDGGRRAAVRDGKVILLVHGATWPSQPAFDLDLPGYSLMETLALAGYDVYALDIHGYGRSGQTDDWSDSRSAAEDIAAVVESITDSLGIARLHLLGWSWGTLTSGLFTERHAERVSSLVLYAPFWHGSAQLRATPRPQSQYRENTDAAAREDFIPGEADPLVVDAFVRAALAAAPRSPNGVLADLGDLPLLDPASISVPTLIIHGEQDWLSSQDDLLPFFARLANPNKAYVVLPDGGHAIMFERQRPAFVAEVVRFLDRTSVGS